MVFIRVGGGDWDHAHKHCDVRAREVKGACVGSGMGDFRCRIAKVAKGRKGQKRYSVVADPSDLLTLFVVGYQRA